MVLMSKPLYSHRVVDENIYYVYNMVSIPTLGKHCAKQHEQSTHKQSERWMNRSARNKAARMVCLEWEAKGKRALDDMKLLGT
jgi:hypothetical protein